MPAMPRACRHNQRGFAVLAGGCHPYLLLLRREGKRGQPSTSVVLSGCPPRNRRRDGARLGSAVARSSGRRGPEAASHGAAATRAELQLIYRGSKNI